VVDLLLTVPEYRQAAGRHAAAGPKIILGNPRRKAGRIFVEMTGGTQGPKDIYPRLKACGVRTILSMHMSEEHFRIVKDADLSVVIAGHIPSDTLGMNLLLDRVTRGKALTVVPCSGFRRILR
jgi:hypothetical protein